MRNVIGFGFVAMLSLAAFAASYDYSVAKVESFQVTNSKQLEVTFKIKCNQKYIRNSVTTLSKPGTVLEEPLLGISIIVYTNHALDCAVGAGDKDQTVTVLLEKDLGLYSGVEFVRP